MCKEVNKENKEENKVRGIFQQSNATLSFIIFLKLIRECAVHSALQRCSTMNSFPHCKRKTIPEAESQEIMSGDDINSLELLFLCRWQLPLMEKIYWFGIKLHTHLGHSLSHLCITQEYC